MNSMYVEHALFKMSQQAAIFETNILNVNIKIEE